jgi:Mg2+ and Co2+ transporter CorA
MVRQMDQLHKDPALQRDQDRRRDMDRLHDHLRTMIQDLDKAQQTLRSLASG